MPFPNIKPSARSWDAGDFPVKIFKTQAGVETRILYGSRRQGAQMSLSYQNITDALAKDFFEHFEETKGTFASFDIPANVRAGWAQANLYIGAGNKWRYAEPPEITSVFPGRSSVTVKLVAVL